MRWWRNFKVSIIPIVLAFITPLAQLIICSRAFVHGSCKRANTTVRTDHEGATHDVFRSCSKVLREPLPWTIFVLQDVRFPNSVCSGPPSVDCEGSLQIAWIYRWPSWVISATITAAKAATAAVATVVAAASTTTIVYLNFCPYFSS